MYPQRSCPYVGRRQATAVVPHHPSSAGWTTCLFGRLQGWKRYVCAGCELSDLLASTSLLQAAKLCNKLWSAGDAVSNLRRRDDVGRPHAALHCTLLHCTAREACRTVTDLAWGCSAAGAITSTHDSGSDSDGLPGRERANAGRRARPIGRARHGCNSNSYGYSYNYSCGRK